ncbi:MAG: heme NO-binding domain-containing protein [Lacibacter sp.]
MYGIVNKAVEELITANYGAAVWKQVLHTSGVDVDFFISNEPYDDAITYQLAIAASQVLQVDLSTVLILLGEYWILKTGKEKYGGLLEAGGKNLREFLINLPAFHKRIMIMYPKLTPPEFELSNVEENSVWVHYFSKRNGLKDFVQGLLQGLGKLYKTEIEIELLQDRDKGADHEIFKVSW